MGFDLERFAAAKFEPRRSKIDVEALAAWFDEGEAPVWEVRGLNANELHQAIEAGKRQSSIDAIVRAIAASGDVADAVRKALGLSGDIPGENAKRLEMLVLGSISPKIELHQAVILAQAFPVEFLLLTNEIMALTGKGHDWVKPAAASEKTETSLSA